MSLNAAEIAALATEFKSNYKPAPKPTTSSSRVKIVAGSVQVGGMISGQVVSGLGKIWVETVRDEDACVYGLQPGMNHRVSMQYAYFN